MTWPMAKLCLLFISGCSLVQGIGIEAARQFFAARGTKVAHEDCTTEQRNCAKPSPANGFCLAGVACGHNAEERCCSNAVQCPDSHGHCNYIINQNHDVSGQGDPHMTNINGDNFEINYVGIHSLIRIPGYGKTAGKSLEVTSRVANFSYLKPISKCHPFYFNMFDIRGKLLGNGVRNLQVRRDSSGISLDSVMVDSNQSVLNRTLNNHTSSEPPSMFGSVKVIHKTKQARDLLVFEIQSSHKIVVTIDWWNSKPGQPGLNINVHGLSPKMETVGGLLGTDPHKEVSSDPEIKGCPKRQEAEHATQSKNLNATESERPSAANPGSYDVAELIAAMYPDVGNSDLK